MDYATTRATIVPEIVKLISEKYHITEIERWINFTPLLPGLALPMMKQVFTDSRHFMCLGCFVRSNHNKKVQHYATPLGLDLLKKCRDARNPVHYLPIKDVKT